MTIGAMPNAMQTSSMKKVVLGNRPAVCVCVSLTREAHFALFAMVALNRSIAIVPGA